MLQMHANVQPRHTHSWGQSAGGISVALQMLTNDGDPEGLFRGAIMSSGSLVPTGKIEDLQGTYDFVVEHVGCGGAADSLACLRTVSTDSLLRAASDTPSFTSLGVSICIAVCRGVVGRAECA